MDRMSAAIEARRSIGESGIGPSTGKTTLVVSGSTGSSRSSDKRSRPARVLSSSASHSALARTSSSHSHSRCVADASSTDALGLGRLDRVVTFSDTTRGFERGAMSRLDAGRSFARRKARSSGREHVTRMPSLRRAYWADDVCSWASDCRTASQCAPARWPPCVDAWRCQASSHPCGWRCQRRILVSRDTHRIRASSRASACSGGGADACQLVCPGKASASPRIVGRLMPSASTGDDRGDDISGASRAWDGGRITGSFAIATERGMRCSRIVSRPM